MFEETKTFHGKHFPTNPSCFLRERSFIYLLQSDTESKMLAAFVMSVLTVGSTQSKMIHHVKF